MRFAGFGCAVAAVAVWSTNAVAAKVALADMTVPQVLLLQFGGAAATMLAIQALRRPRRRLLTLPEPQLLVLGLVGLFGTITLQYLAFEHAPITEANILAYGWPLFVAVWAAALRRSLASFWFVALALCGFAGVALIAGDGLAFRFSGAYAAGYAFALASACCMAFYTLAAGLLRDPGPEVLLPATLVGCLAMALLVLRDGSAWPAAGTLLVGLYIGVGPMALGYLLWTRAMAAGESNRLAPIGYLTPVFSTALLLISGEALGPHAVIGMTLVLGASAGTLFFRDRTAAARPGGFRIVARRGQGAGDRQARGFGKPGAVPLPRGDL